MLKIGLRSAKKRFWGLAASVLAVFLGVTFVASTLSLKEVLNSTFDNIVSSSLNGAAYIRAVGTEVNYVTGAEPEPTVPISLIQELSELPGVSAVAPDVSEDIVLVGKDGTAVSSSGAPTLAIAAYPNPGDRFAQGHGPNSSSEIAMTVSTAEAAGYSLGDTVTAIMNGDIMTFTLVGTLNFGASAGSLLTFIEPNFAEQTFAPQGTSPLIALFSTDQNNPDDLIIDEQAEKTFVDGLRTAGLTLSAADGTELEIVTGTEMREATLKTASDQVGFIVGLVLAFAFVAILVSGFVIANAFAMVARQQQREYALLRAVGASPSQVFTLVAVQAVFVGVLGSALGLAASFGFLKVLPSLFAQIGMDMSGEATLSLTTIASGIAVGVGISFVSALVSARKAAQTPPVEAIRDVAAPTLDLGRRRSIAGFALVALGAAAVISASIIARSQEIVSTGPLYGLGGLLLVVGVLVVAAHLVRPFVSGVGRPLEGAFGTVARLARGNVQRNPKRTAATSSALVLGTTLTVGASIFAASINGAVGSVVKNELKADYIVQSASFDIAPSAQQKLEGLDGVNTIGSFISAAVSIPELKVDKAAQAQAADDLTFDPTRLEIGATENYTFDDLWNVRFIEGEANSLHEGKALVQKSVALDNNWSVGERVTITTAQQSSTIIIGAIFDSPALGVPVLVPRDFLQELVPETEMHIINLLIEAAGDPEALRPAITEVIAPYMVLSLYNQQEFSELITSQVDQMLMIVYALLALTIVIAIIGVINTLSLSIVERTREIGLLRAVGLSNRQLRSVISIESVMTCVFGTALGLAVGVGATVGLPNVLRDQGLTELTIPWTSLAVIVAISIIVGLLAATLPASRALRTPVLTAIKENE